MLKKEFKSARNGNKCSNDRKEESYKTLGRLVLGWRLSIGWSEIVLESFDPNNLPGLPEEAITRIDFCRFR